MFNFKFRLYLYGAVATAVLIPALRNNGASQWPILAAIGAIGLIALIDYRRTVRSDALGEYALCKPTNQLEPADLNFRPANAGDTRNQDGQRPMHDVYIPRHVIRYEDWSQGKLQPVYPERVIADTLAEGENVLFIGAPMQGKTRCALESLKSLTETWVIRLKPGHRLSDDAIAAVFDQAVVCVLDDAHDLDIKDNLLLENINRLSADRREPNIRRNPIALLATNRDGPEFSDLERGNKLLARFLVENRFVLLPLKDAEAAELAGKVGADPSRAYATPGEICMQSALSEIHDRFHNQVSVPAKDVFRTARLLVHWGVRPLDLSRLRQTSAMVRDPGEGALDATELRDALNNLRELGFLRSLDGADPVRFEDAYLTGQFADRFFETIPDVPDKLAEFLLGFADGDGAHDIAVSLFKRSQFDVCVRVLDQMLSASSDDHLRAVAYCNKGTVLAMADNPSRNVESAIQSYDELIARYGNSRKPLVKATVAQAYVQKGVALAGQIESRQWADAPIKTWETLVTRYGNSSVPQVQVYVAQGYLNIGVWHGSPNNPANDASAEISAYDRLIDRFGSSSLPDVQQCIANAYVNKGMAQISRVGHDHHISDAVATWETLIARFHDSRIPELEDAVLRAYINLGVASFKAENPARNVGEAIRYWEALIERFKDSSLPAAKEAVPRAEMTLKYLRG